MAQGSGLRIAAVREMVRRDRGVLAVDLGEDKQVAVVIGHDGRVLGRKVVKAKAHRLGGLVEWGAGVAGRGAQHELTRYRRRVRRGMVSRSFH